MQRLNAVLGVTTLLLISGCGGDEEGGNLPLNPSSYFCESMKSSAPTVTVTCLGCSAESEDAAVDGNIGSATTLVPLLPLQPTFAATIRATATSGMVYPAGSKAGAIVAQHASSNGSFLNANLITYLDGVPQETSVTSGLNSYEVDGFGLYWFETRKPFNAVEVAEISILGQNVPGPGPYYEVFEFCSDSSVH